MGQKRIFVCNIHWIWSIMKIYICSILAQSLYWEKSCSWDIDQNALSQSDCRVFKSTIPREQIYETVSFFACFCKFLKIKSWLKLFWLGMVKSRCNQSGLWTLKVIVSGEWTDRINWCFACWYKFIQIIRCLIIFWGGIMVKSMSRWSKLLFACWWKFRKTNSWFNDFLSGVVKNGHDLLVRET